VIDYFKKAMGERIKTARETTFKGTVSQKQIAIFMNKHWRTIQNWEEGKTTPKHLDMIKLANILKVSVKDLTYGPKGKLPDSIKQLIKTYFPEEK